MLSSSDNLREAGVGSIFRPRDVAPHGISHRGLQSLVSSGTVEKLGKGLYRLSAAEPTELETIAMVAAATPNAIFCLLTALSLHDIGTQSPHEVWIAIDRKAHKPTHFPARVRVMRFSGAMLTYGVVRDVAQGVPYQVTSPARTVVDCFRYRNKLGLDVALEALQDVLRSKSATVDEITRAAEVCRIRTVLRPYLEAIRV
ncbi:MAG: type IV toxin-antitoxin system AbiEi family antitoxin domain-containing protein [Deltaproteobacteria bacterium]|nr:type IV toxin-antitoxin system AbiEi family antitoxin domain-containing protein [Deltaproteobacteria bacterium]